MTFGEPNMSSGSPPDHHPEQLKVPITALEPLEAGSSAPVHRIDSGTFQGFSRSRDAF